MRSSASWSTTDRTLDRMTGRRSSSSTATRLTGAQWAAQADALEREFHCLAPDLPGHGTPRPTPFTLDGAADRRRRRSIATEAHDGRAVLVGLSLGGYVAMAVAARLARAGRGPRHLPAPPPSRSASRSLFFRGLAWAVFRLRTARLARPPAPGTSGGAIRTAIADPIVAGGFSFRGGAARRSGRSSGAVQAAPRRAIRGPSLLVNGEYDLFFRLGERSFADVAADPRRVVIRRASHLANLDQPEAFTAVVRRFARSLPPAAETAAGR